MPETIQGLGHILREWRMDDKDAAGAPASVDEWAARLQNAGWMESRATIVYLLNQAERFDYWTLTFSCDCFEDFLSAMQRGIYRGQRDAQHWIDLNAIFVSPRRRCLGVPDL